MHFGRRRVIFELEIDDRLKSEQRRIIRVWSGRRVQQLDERMSGWPSRKKKPRKLYPGRLVLGIEIKDRLQSGSKCFPLMGVLFGLCETAPCRQEIFF